MQLMKSYSHGTPTRKVIGFITVEGEYIVERLTIKADRLKLPTGLVIDDLTISGRDISFIPSTSVSLMQPAEAIVIIRQESLRQYLEALAPGGLSGFEVNAGSGIITVSALARIVISIRATALCKLDVSTDKTISVVIESVDPPPARHLVERQVAQINPIVDLTTLPYDLRIVAVQILDGYISIKGTVAV